MNDNYKLEVALVGDTEIHLTRKFRFPASLVYHAFTDHGNYHRWVGCNYGVCTESTGGNSIGDPWSFRMDMGEMGQFHTFGQCLEAIPSERYVRTFIYNVPEIRESASVEVATFSEEGGVTTFKVVVRHLSKAARDGHFNSGMEQGAASSYDALETYLQTK